MVTTGDWHGYTHSSRLESLRGGSTFYSQHLDFANQKTNFVIEGVLLHTTLTKLAEILPNFLCGSLLTHSTHKNLFRLALPTPEQKIALITREQKNALPTSEKN